MCQILVVTPKKLSAKEKAEKNSAIEKTHPNHPKVHFASEDDKNHLKTINKFENKHPKGIIMFPSN